MLSITNPPPHRYSSLGFERAAERRTDPAYLQRQLVDGRARFIRFVGLHVVAEPFLVEREVVGNPTTDEALFLGEQSDGGALFAVRVDEGETAASDLRHLTATLNDVDAGLAAYGRALWHWHDDHRFCGRCGGPMRPAQGGHLRRCEACGHQVFPRMDPAVIVLVTCGDFCLLGRSPRFPERMYSTLAGFVEPGESLEDTIRREIFEEAGVTVVASTYRSSQPWPFPQSLMLGFQATAADQSLKIDQNELADADWFHRQQLADPANRPVDLPRVDSIARFLIEDWLYGRP